MAAKKYPIGGFAPGNYHGKCRTCGSDFQGDKRASQCEPCATEEQNKYDALSDEEKKEVYKRNIEIFEEWLRSDEYKKLWKQ